MYLNVCVSNEFLAARNGKKLSFGLFRPNLPQLGLFHPYFLCKCSFREISMIKVILDQNIRGVINPMEASILFHLLNGGEAFVGDPPKPTYFRCKSFSLHRTEKLITDYSIP